MNVSFEECGKEEIKQLIHEVPGRSQHRDESFLKRRGFVAVLSVTLLVLVALACGMFIYEPSKIVKIRSLNEDNVGGISTNQKNSTGVRLCDNDPCNNEARCSEEMNTIHCKCKPGYTGVHCETDIDECASNPCLNRATCIDGVNSFTCQCRNLFVGTLCQKDLCPVLTPQPILILQHFDSSPFFRKSWDEMLREQGNKTGDYWIGLERLHYLTTYGRYKLYIYMETTQNTQLWTEYASMVVNSSADNYRLILDWPCTGPGGHGLVFQDRRMFSTFDRDNDETGNRHYAVSAGGAFWYGNSNMAFLTGSPFLYCSWTSLHIGIYHLTYVRMELSCGD